MTEMTDDEFRKIVDNCRSFLEASRICGTSYKIFKERANRLGITRPGKRENTGGVRYSTEDILAGKYPQYESYDLKIRLIEEGYKEDKCEICGWSEKFPGSKYSNCELDHFNGDTSDHRLENLMLLCPNCRSLTRTYKCRLGNKNKNKAKEFLTKLENEDEYSQDT